jgi:hypothetical protein
LQAEFRHLLQKFHGYRLIHKIDYANALAMHTTINDAHALLMLVRDNFITQNDCFPPGRQRDAQVSRKSIIFDALVELWVRWKQTLPLVAMNRQLQAHLDAGLPGLQSPTTETLCQYTKSTLHQQRNNLRAVFAKYGINTEECECICTWFNIEGEDEMADLTIRTIREWADIYDRRDDKKLFRKLVQCVKDFHASDCCIHSFLEEYELFFATHPDCRPVQVDDTNRTGYMVRPSTMYPGCWY